MFLVSSGSSSSSSLSDSSSDSSSLSSSSEDFDDIFGDKTYVPFKENNILHSTSEDELNIDNKDNRASVSIENSANEVNLSEINTLVVTSPLKKGRKRQRNEDKWKRNIDKKLRNKGQLYESHCASKKMRKERQMKSPCKETCKLKCSSKFNDENRKELFSGFWELGDIERQRQFISNSMQTIQPKYRYIRQGGIRSPRNNNNAFYFILKEQKVRVCKLFFKNTLDINDRPIRTVLEKQNKIVNTLLEGDRRGKHGKHVKLDDNIRDGIIKHISSIPKIESHYARADTSKHFIDGSRSIADIHRDYVADCKEKNIPFGNYVLFYRIFTQKFNISFFQPKKDLCDTCVAYNNAIGEDKNELKNNYEEHLVEKDLSRTEKQLDKEKSNLILAVYDLQAVMPLPKGDVSTFYYRSKLNVLNFTIYDMQKNIADCYVWDESNGHRGVNELGTCIWKYLEMKSDKNEGDVIFYSDNCPGQNKNKFILALYLHAVRQFKNIKTITHKYLIKGHTQNEGDSVHSLIERQCKKQLKSGPIYTPEAFVSIIRTAKKTGEPYHVHELCYEDFYDIKSLCTQIGVNITVNTENEAVKFMSIKIMKVEKQSPSSIFYKTSYSQAEFKEAIVIRRKKTVAVELKKEFSAKPGISEKKKEDLLYLVKKNCIPSFYKPYYEQL